MGYQSVGREPSQGLCHHPQALLGGLEASWLGGAASARAVILHKYLAYLVGGTLQQSVLHTPLPALSQILSIGGTARPFALQGHHARISSVKWSPDGTGLASGSEDCSVRPLHAAGTTLPSFL